MIEMRKWMLIPYRYCFSAPTGYDCRAVSVPVWKIWVWVWLVIWACFQTGYAQNALPLMKSYDYSDYNARPLIWDAVQDSRGMLYFANNDGVLHYDGVNWQTLPTPAPVRALAIDESDRIYVGCMGDLGFLEAGQQGLTYRSANTLAPEAISETEDYERIYILQDGVYYVSGQRVVHFTPTDTGAVLDSYPVGKLAGSGSNGEELYINIQGDGLKRFVSGQLTSVPGGAKFGEETLSFLTGSAGSLLVATADNGLFRQTGDDFEADFTGLLDLFQRDGIYKGIKLANGHIGLATYSGGVLIVRPDGGLEAEYSRRIGFPSNELYSIFEDRERNLWIGHSSGLTRLSPAIEARTYGHLEGWQGKLSDVHTFGDRLYIATFSGVYAMSLNGGTRFEQVSQLDLETLDLAEVSGRLFAATSAGLYEIEGTRGRLRVPDVITQKLVASERHPGRAYLMLAKGVRVLELNDGFADLGAIAGVSENVSAIAEDAEGVWLGTNYQGLIYASFDQPANAELQRYGAAEGLPEGLVKPLKISGSVTFRTREGFFYFDADSRTFKPDLNLNDHFGARYHDFVPLGDDDWLLYSNRTMIRVEPEGGDFVLDSALVANIPDEKIEVANVADESIWVAYPREILRMPRRMSRPGADEFYALIREVRTAQDSLLFADAYRTGPQQWQYTQLAEREPSLPYRLNTMRFRIAAASFLNEQANEYQYKLEGLDTEWSPWQTQTEISYSNLFEGTYTLRVRARNALGQMSQEAQYRFTIQSPWYRTIVAYISGGLLFLGLGFVILRANSKRLERQNKLLEATVAERTQEINEQKQALEDQKNQLEQAYAELQSTQTQLIQSEKMAMLGQLVAGVAHEINTPIGAIKASTYNMTQQLPVMLGDYPKLYNSLSEEHRELFFGLVEQTIKPRPAMTSREERQARKQITAWLEEQGLEQPKGVASDLVKIGVTDQLEPYIPLFKHPEAEDILRMVSTVGNMQGNLNNIELAVSKTGKIVYALKSYSHQQADETPVEVDVAQNIDTVLTIYNNQLKENVEVERNIPDEVVQIQGYADQLSQVWTNIIHNALQAMDHQGRIRVDVLPEAEHVEVRITDSGPGIPQEIVGRIFDPFFTTKSAGEGSGLGLDICRKIIRKHQGELSVDTEPGRTTFIARLPRRWYNEHPDEKPAG